MIETNFKHTEIGLIPHDWEVKTLGKHASIFRGGSPRPIEAFITNSVDGINWLKIGDVAPTDKYFTKCVEKILPSGVAHSRRVFAGDFILSNSMSFGRPYILKIDGCIHDGWLVIQDYATSFNMEYLYYVLSSDFVKYQYISMAAGSSVQNLNKDKVACVQIITPPTLAEQERIAGALSSIDTLIGALNEQIEKKRHIKQGTMQQLLTGKKRLAGFTGEWKEVRLGDVAKMNSGGTPTSTNPAYYNGDIPFLSISDMTSSGKYIQSTEKTITQLGIENSSARLFPTGTLMYAMYASIGKCSITNIDTAISQAILGFKLSDALDRDYLYYHFCFIENIVKDMGQTGTQSNLSKKIVEDFELTIPPTIAEQRAIAAVLSGMDTEIAALEQKRDKNIAIKSGMMQDLLTGKIRLV